MRTVDLPPNFTSSLRAVVTSLAVLIALVPPVATLDAQASPKVASTKGAPVKSAPGVPAASTLDSSTFAAMTWRNIGPFRGGRSVAATGIPQQPMTYFAGYTGGGLWRTDDAGNNWRNISDGFSRRALLVRSRSHHLTRM